MGKAIISFLLTLLFLGIFGILMVGGVIVLLLA